jgi:hypothetical protein
MAARPLQCQDKRMKDDNKADRLAAALRENLRRRKAQTRALSDQPHGKRDGDHHREDDS